MKSDKNRQTDPRAGRTAANRVILRRTLFLMAVCGVVFFIPLVGRLYQLQIVQHQELESRAIDQQTWDKEVIANRGTIYDANGNVLAMSAEAYYIQLSPHEIEQRQEEYREKVEKANAAETPEEREELMPDYPEPTNESIAQSLAEMLDLDAADILERLGRTDSWSEVIKTQVESDQADLVRTYAKENGLSAGIYVLPSSKRYYPYGSLAAQIIGWVNYNDGNRGAYGLEALYDEELSGQTGRIVTAKDGTGKQLLYRYEDYEDAVDGMDLHLTLDATIQSYCERVLTEGVEKFEAQDGGFVLAMDPDTGAILGWANSPSYDLNEPRTISDENLSAQLQAILNDSSLTDEEKSAQQTNLLYQQWSNKALNQTYEPGSTFKSIVLAAALEEGMVNENDTFTCTGSVMVDGYPQPIRCSDRDGHGTQNLARAVANSCNPAFIAIGQRLGTSTFYDYLEDFGFLSQTGVDLQGEPSAPNYNLIWPRDSFTHVDLAVASFGQRLQVTPLQLITAAAAVINGGHLMQPYVVESVTDADGNVVQHTEPTEVRQVISEETSERCRTILEQVVIPPGTGKQAYVAGYRIGGKTGSSETLEDDHTIVSFLGFAPANDPEVIVLIAYDNPKPTGPNSNYTSGMYYISGGNMAAPQAGELIPDILDYMGVAKQYTDEEKAAMDVAVPNVIGLTLEEATAKLADSGLEVRTVGEGAAVTDQTPLTGVAIPGGSEVILYLGAEKPTDKVTVPNLQGLNREQAEAALSEVGLYLKATGLTVGSDVKAESQAIAEGTQVERGTVVEVHFIQSTASGGASSGL